MYGKGSFRTPSTEVAKSGPGDEVDASADPGTKQTDRFSVWLRRNAESGNANRLIFFPWHGSTWQVLEACRVIPSSNERFLSHCIFADWRVSAAHIQPANRLTTTAVSTMKEITFIFAIKRSTWVSHSMVMHGFLTGIKQQIKLFFG
ncbi:MAG: hypothetical protein KFF68_06785 [Desulfosarcina sp.]|nr:hypothetical protein [Desulfosarcina sp.]